MRLRLAEALRGMLNEAAGTLEIKGSLPESREVRQAHLRSGSKCEILIPSGCRLPLCPR
jgi:hypothetical protein